jgi:amidohydrolase
LKLRDLLPRARNRQDRLVAWRREIHMHPELGFQEERTARLVAGALGEMGLQVETGVAKTGVVATLGRGRPAIALRADMDALQVQEANDVPYASRRPGLMHACGHDAHTAMLLGAAQLLRTMPDRPAGQVRFLFQPCEEAWDEEGKSGALRLIEAGALAGVDAALALHVDPAAPAGQVGVRSGHVMAAVDPFSATVIGAGCHSSAPHQGLNPIFLLVQVLNAIQGIPTLRISPLQPAIISLESIHGGGTTGVIPEEVTFHGNVRCYDEEVRRRLHEELEKAFGIVRALGGDYRLEIRRYYPACYNDPGITGVVGRVAEALVGAEGLYQPELEMAGEDFAYIAGRVPACLVRLGVKAGEVARPLHSPLFDIDEAALPLGAALLAGAACRLLDEV